MLPLMSQVLVQTMPDVGADRLAFLSGPSFAREVASGLPTDVVVASRGTVAAGLCSGCSTRRSSGWYRTD